MRVGVVQVEVHFWISPLDHGDDRLPPEHVARAERDVVPPLLETTRIPEAKRHCGPRSMVVVAAITFA